MLGPGLGHGEVADVVEVCVFDRHFPAAFGFVGFLPDDVFHDFLPGARAEFGIGAVDVDAGQGEVEMRLAFGFVVGLEETLGLLAIAGFEAGLLSGGFVFEIEGTPRTLDQTELLFHRFTHGCECKAVGTFSIREQWAYSQRTGGEFVPIVKQVKIPVKIRPYALPNLLPLRQLELEARVGIGRRRRDFGRRIA